MEAEILHMEINLRHLEQLGRVPLKQLFSERVYRRPTLVMMVLFVFRPGMLDVNLLNITLFISKEVMLNSATEFSKWQPWLRQLNGNMAVVLYLTEIFDKANTGIDPGLQATLVCLVQVIERKRLGAGILYRVIIQVVTNLPLTSKQRLVHGPHTCTSFCFVTL